MTPGDLGSNGTRLWRSVADDYALDVHEELLLLKACRVATGSTSLPSRPPLAR